MINIIGFYRKGKKKMNKKYSDELKEQVVKEYLSGAKMMDLVRKYDLSDKNRIRLWTEKYLKYGAFPDGRGRAKNRGKRFNIDPASMSQDEYIRYLEMENAVLKQLRSLNNSQVK